MNCLCTVIRCRVPLFLRTLDNKHQMTLWGAPKTFATPVHTSFPTSSRWVRCSNTVKQIWVSNIFWQTHSHFYSICGRICDTRWKIACCVLWLPLTWSPYISCVTMHIEINLTNSLPSKRFTNFTFNEKNNRVCYEPPRYMYGDGIDSSYQIIGPFAIRSQLVVVKLRLSHLLCIYTSCV